MYGERLTVWYFQHSEHAHAKTCNKKVPSYPFDADEEFGYKGQNEKNFDFSNNSSNAF